MKHLYKYIQVCTSFEEKLARISPMYQHQWKELKDILKYVNFAEKNFMLKNPQQNVVRILVLSDCTSKTNGRNCYKSKNVQ